jgi:hypothetical protein
MMSFSPSIRTESSPKSPFRRSSVHPEIQSPSCHPVKKFRLPAPDTTCRNRNVSPEASLRGSGVSPTLRAASKGCGPAQNERTDLPRRRGARRRLYRPRAPGRANKRILERLRADGFTGGCRVVKGAARKLDPDFPPLLHFKRPGRGRWRSADPAAAKSPEALPGWDCLFWKGFGRGWAA